MALSNRERVGRMFEIMSPPLERFIANLVEPSLPSGMTWLDVVIARDRQGAGTSNKDYSAADPLVQLRMLADPITDQYRHGWRPFNGQLSRVHQNYANQGRLGQDLGAG
jgi:hypothetical protein